ncbi:MAG: hypothetical protein GSR84_04505 [Desulfurococcales archaeon]|nr:hypothetical protein [Desulfurococcales archaeon]
MPPKLLLVVGVLLVVLGFLTGYTTANALTPSLLVNPSSNIGPVLPPNSSSTSLGYNVGYVVEIYRNNILNTTADYATNFVNVTHLANTGSVSVLYNLGYGLASESYAKGLTANGSVATVVDPTPDVITTTVYNETTTTQTVTTTWVTTTTVIQGRTYTITSPVPLAPTTVTVEGEGGFPAGLALAGIGLVLLVLAGALMRKG